MAIRSFVVATAISILVTLTAFAHEGVKNPAVMERMHAMKSVAKQVKTLGDMAKGATAFDAATAQAAGTEIARHAEMVPALFEAEEMDPKTEAKPEIWQNWSDFTQKNAEFEAAARTAAQITSPDDLAAAMRALGDSCKSCHELYRIEN